MSSLTIIFFTQNCKKYLFEQNKKVDKNNFHVHIVLLKYPFKLVKKKGEKMLIISVVELDLSLRIINF